jgi:hypothetical protein
MRSSGFRLLLNPLLNDGIMDIGKKLPMNTSLTVIAGSPVYRRTGPKGFDMHLPQQVYTRTK